MGKMWSYVDFTEQERKDIILENQSSCIICINNLLNCIQSYFSIYSYKSFLGFTTGVPYENICLKSTSKHFSHKISSHSLYLQVPRLLSHRLQTSWFFKSLDDPFLLILSFPFFWILISQLLQLLKSWIGVFFQSHDYLKSCNTICLHNIRTQCQNQVFLRLQ